MSAIRFDSLHRLLAPWLVLLLLVAQGLRVCVPGAGEHDHHDSAIHLESLFTAAADQHESGHDDAGDTDLTLSVLLKLFNLVLAGGLLALATQYFITRERVRCCRPDEPCPRSPRISGMSPPLRAPPR